MFLASSGTPDLLSSVLKPLSDFATRQIDAAVSKGPSFLRGWSFLKFETTSEPGSLPARAAPRHDAPTVIVGEPYLTLSKLEDPAAAPYWLPLVLNHFCTEMLHETSEDGLFASHNWRCFRDVACMHASMTWDEALAAADRDGVESMAEFLAQALYVESGLLEMLDDRATRAALSFGS